MAICSPRALSTGEYTVADGPDHCRISPFTSQRLPSTCGCGASAGGAVRYSSRNSPVAMTAEDRGAEGAERATGVSVGPRQSASAGPSPSASLFPPRPARSTNASTWPRCPRTPAAAAAAAPGAPGSRAAAPVAPAWWRQAVAAAARVLLLSGVCVCLPWRGRPCRARPRRAAARARTARLHVPVTWAADAGPGRHGRHGRHGPPASQQAGRAGQGRQAGTGTPAGGQAGQLADPAARGPAAAVSQTTARPDRPWCVSAPRTCVSGAACRPAASVIR